MLFEYKGFHNCDSVCDIEIYNNIVLCTELKENVGTSITNMAEKVATLACEKFNIPQDKLIWIEHYPKGRVSGETFSIVSFDICGKRFTSPSWKTVKKKDVEEMIGRKFTYDLKMDKDEAMFLKKALLKLYTDESFIKDNQKMLEAVIDKVSEIAEIY